MFNYAIDFVKFFFPKKFVKTLDFQRGIDTNTEDLQKLLPDYGKKGTVVPDKLFRVYEKNGDENLVLIHVEVEKNPKTEILGRMFRYFMRLRDRFPNMKITALVVYIGERVPKKHNIYTYSFGGTKLTYEFNFYVVKKQDEKKLMQSKNPFSIAILACFYIIKAKKNYEKLYHYKRKLFYLCLGRKYSKPKIRDFIL